jgi:hypothetical protein
MNSIDAARKAALRLVNRIDELSLHLRLSDRDLNEFARDYVDDPQYDNDVHFVDDELICRYGPRSAFLAADVVAVYSAYRGFDGAYTHICELMRVNGGFAELKRFAERLLRDIRTLLTAKKGRTDPIVHFDPETEIALVRKNLESWTTRLKESVDEFDPQRFRRQLRRESGHALATLSRQVFADAARVPWVRVADAAIYANVDIKSILRAAKQGHIRDNGADGRQRYVDLMSVKRHFDVVPSKRLKKSRSASSKRP